MMNNTWIVVADNVSARFHSWTLPVVIADVAPGLVHAEGRLRSRDLVTDRPGESRNDASTRPQSFALRTTPADQERERFAQQIAGAIEEAFAARRFSELALVMSPKLLGLVRAGLSERVRATVIAELGQRLTGRPIDEVVERINNVRRPATLA